MPWPTASRAVGITTEFGSAQEAGTGGARPAVALGSHAPPAAGMQAARVPGAGGSSAMMETRSGVPRPGWAATHDGQWAGVVRWQAKS
jgi:hypothetical protein